MHAELVIFACDGVLVDSERIAVRIDAVVLSQLGWDLIEEEIIERFVGRSHEFMVSEIAGRRRVSVVEGPHALEAGLLRLPLTASQLFDRKADLARFDTDPHRFHDTLPRSGFALSSPHSRAHNELARRLGYSHGQLKRQRRRVVAKH